MAWSATRCTASSTGPPPRRQSSATSSPRARAARPTAARAAWPAACTAAATRSAVTGTRCSAAPAPARRPSCATAPAAAPCTRAATTPVGERPQAGLPQPDPGEQAVEVDPVDPGRARGGADVVAVQHEQLLQVAALDVAQPALADLAQRQADVDRRLVGARRRGALLADQARLDVVAQLAHVAGPAVAEQLRQQLAA